MDPIHANWEEVHYNSERNIMRQFMILQQEQEVPVFLTMKHFTNWLMTKWKFMDEYQGLITERTEWRELLLSELIWKSKRLEQYDCMKQEICRELDIEHRLSLRFGRKVTTEGLKMMLEKVQLTADLEVKLILATFPSNLPYQSKEGPAMFIEIAGAFSPEIVYSTLSNILQDPEAEDGLVGHQMSAIREVAKPVEETAATIFTEVPLSILGTMSFKAAVDIVDTVSNKLEEGVRTFDHLGFDSTLLESKATVLDALVDIKANIQMSNLPEIPKQLVVPAITISLILSQVQCSSQVMQASASNVVKALSVLPWVSVTEQQEFGNVLLQYSDVSNVIADIGRQFAALKKRVGDNPNLDRHLEYLVAVNIASRVPDEYLSNYEEVQLTRYVMARFLESSVNILTERQTSDPGSTMEELVEVEELQPSEVEEKPLENMAVEEPEKDWTENSTSDKLSLFDVSNPIHNDDADIEVLLLQEKTEVSPDLCTGGPTEIRGEFFKTLSVEAIF
ncbi:uncharacterized protein LOC109616125 [Esox lucius]|uniref:uncharacterized protein LOC109616125 n=1 Tax=Esox lucius TaxID=8010 RepID=UPI001477825C|nr:uncharacterized protein LOC109616125 [Esox lucius]